MSAPAEKSKDTLIEGAMELGFSFSEAVQKALGQSLSEFAREHGFRQTEVSMCLLGYHQRTYPDIRDAVADSLDVPRERVDRWIDGGPVEATEGAA